MGASFMNVLVGVDGSPGSQPCLRSTTGALGWPSSLMHSGVAAQLGLEMSLLRGRFEQWG